MTTDSSKENKNTEEAPNSTIIALKIGEMDVVFKRYTVRAMFIQPPRCLKMVIDDTLVHLHSQEVRVCITKG